MDQGLLPRRYAKALYKYALEKGVDKDVYADMQNIADAFETNPDLQHTIANPFVDNDTKRALISTAAGVKAQGSAPVLTDFVSLLINNRRIDLLHAMALAYLDIYRKVNNIYKVSVLSAAPLSDADRNRITALINSHLKGGTAQYTFATDPDLIGGFVVTIDNERLDASVKNELKQLRLNLIK